MSESPQGRSKQHMRLKHAAIYITVTIYASIAIAVMLFMAFLRIVVSTIRTPHSTWTRIADARKKYVQTTSGRFFQVAEIGVVLYLAANGLLWLYKHYY